MNTDESKYARLLRRTLLTNSAFSALSAVTFLAAAAPLARQVALGIPWFSSTAINLFVFSALLLFIGTRPRLDRIWIRVLVLFIAVLDLLWTMSSGMIAVLPSMTTVVGVLLVAVSGLTIGAFGVLQIVSVWGMSRSFKAQFGKAAAFVLIPILLSSCAPADIRNRQVREHGQAQASFGRGRELLLQVAERHGLAAWKAFKTARFVSVDEWAGFTGRFTGWWPVQKQRFRFDTLLGTFTSRVELLDGPKAGQVMGVQSWKGYGVSSTGARVEPAEDALSTFYLPTLQYFAELPFRILSAQYITYGGERELNGSTYQLIYATWGSLEANPENDQYELWINEDTLLVEKCFYTVRDAFKGAVGTIHFDDYREVQGVMVPFLQTVTLASPESTLYPVENNFFHQMRLESAGFDSFPPEKLIVYPNQTPGDFKPDVGDQGRSGAV